MTPASLLFLAVTACALAGCASTTTSQPSSRTRLAGSAESITWRPSEDDVAFLRSVESGGQQIRRRTAAAQAAPTARLSVVAVGTRQMLATAAYDPAIGGYLFRLPARFAQAGVESICLTLRTARGTPVPLRAEGKDDDGYEFRNPAWEALVQRSTRIQAVRAELAPVEDQHALAEAELAAIEKKYGAPVANGQQPCAAPAAAPAPARPAAAMEKAAAAEAGPGVCALLWEARLGASAEAMFRDTGRADVWSGRASARAAHDALPAPALEVSGGDLELIRSAAVGGPLVLQHQKGLRQFDSAHAACERRVVELAAQMLAAWDEQVRNRAAAPQLARERCEADVRKVPPLRDRLREAQARRNALTARLEELERAGAASAGEASLDATRCR